MRRTNTSGLTKVRPEEEEGGVVKGVYAFDSCHSTRMGRRPSVAAPLGAKLSVNVSNPMAAASLSHGR
jgi:hypothetical protein